MIDAIKNEPEFDQYVQLLQSKRQLDAAQEHAYSSYRRLAGEIEARDTAARASLSDIQRASEMPYASQGIPLEEWIVDFRGGKAASAGKKSLADIELKPAKYPQGQRVMLY